MYGSRSLRALLAGGVCALAMTTAAYAQNRNFDVPAGDLQAALDTYAQQAGIQLLYKVDLVKGVPTRGAHGDLSSDQALAMLLSGTGLQVRHHASGAVAIVDAADPQSGSAAGDGADAGTVAALIVTAQKKEENIQDVPIAISAFTEKSFQEQKIEGGFDLLKAIPNVTFSKNNFSGYNFSIRGIGTKAISVTTDPGVAVEFNSTPLIRNRLFEQEYFDVERVEVLRGPQGTLHGRNATAGVINVISAKPNMTEFNGWLKGEVGNYNTKRLSAMVNVPLVNDKLAIRFAGAATMRDGYSIDLFDNTHDDGRNLWSARLTIGFNPTENIRTNLIWERFNEADDRSRTGKQLCTPDPGPEAVGNHTIRAENDAPLPLQRAVYSQGCLPGSLYDDAAYGAPNGFAIPFIQALAGPLSGYGYDSRYVPAYHAMNPIMRGVDPYAGITQSRDLRSFYSRIHPEYQAKTDVLEWNTDIDVGALSLTFQTGYSKDSIYARQDYNRYTTVPAFSDSTYAVIPLWIPSPFHDLTPSGVFCDPQLGCSDTIVGEDLSRAKSEQFSQEIRVASNFSGPLNFIVGGNILRYRTLEDYYVFSNGLTLTAVATLNGTGYFGPNWHNPAYHDRFTTNPDCSYAAEFFMGFPTPICVPIEQNAISDIQNTGHNYFLSRNPYKLKSNSLFGEAHWRASDALKLTLGLRYTQDGKRFVIIPSQTLLTPNDYVGFQQMDEFYRQYFSALWFTSFGAGSGYPVKEVVTRNWKEVTGRAGVEWKPEVAFTDETMLYAFYSRGYKGGGLNPPPPGFNYEAAKAFWNTPVGFGSSAPPEFEPEFVNAFELGAKNTLLGGAAVLNVTSFFYDYTGYQVSKIVDRSAYNENFDAKVWGLEIEGLLAPTRNLRFNGSLGYLDTALANGSRSIDVMNRTAGHTDWVLMKPLPLLPSNCIVPVWVIEKIACGISNLLR